jgi:glycosyltransferase involved in cell wall biosynthesis
MAILEAMACRLPCLITTACHFPEAAAAGGAVVVSPDPTAVTCGLRELLERTPEERARLGQNARQLVEVHYTWERQAERLAAVYDWLRGGGMAPDAVIQ